MALNRDMENINTVFSEVDMADKPGLELIRIKQKRGHEIIKSYHDLKHFFKGNLKLATPILTESGDVITKVQYSVDENRDDINEISEYEFTDSIRDQVRQEFENFKNRANELGKSNDNRQKKLLIQSFFLPENFDEDGHNNLIRAGSTLYLLNWGFYKLDKSDVNVLPPSGSNLRIRLTKQFVDGNFSINAEISANARDYKFEWEIDGEPCKDQSGKSLKINAEQLKNLDEEFEIKLRVRHSERHSETHTKTEIYRNPLYYQGSSEPPGEEEDNGGTDSLPPLDPDPLTVNIYSTGKHAYSAELNKLPDDDESVGYEWNLNGDTVFGNTDNISLEHEQLRGLPRNSTLSVTVTGYFDGIEKKATTQRKLKISLWDKFLAWWSDPDNRKKVLIALALILLLLLLIFLLNRYSGSGASSVSDRPATQTSQNGMNATAPETGNQQRPDGTVPTGPGVSPSDQTLGPPSGSESMPPSIQGGDTQAPRQDQNEPAPPFTPRGNNAENDLSPNQIREIESTPGTGPIKIGDIYCVESAGKVKVWMKLSGDHIYILDSYSSDQGNCSQYYPAN